MEDRGLDKRITYKYNSSSSYLDEWERIGTYREVSIGEKLYSYDEEDFCDTFMRYIIVDVKSDSPEKVISQALVDNYSFSDCTHEWDCCGCYSFFARAYPLGKNRYCVEHSGERNY